MEAEGTMERRFGELTLDEIKEVYEACANDFMVCDKKCPLYGVRKDRQCIKAMQKSVLELIEAYKTVLPICEHWFKRADVLSGKADKYDSVRNELIRTQEVVKNLQDECRKRADKIKSLRETIDTMDDDYNELDAKLKNEEMVRKSLEVDIKNIEDLINLKQTAIDRLIKEKAETHEELDKLQAERKDLNIQLYDANAAKKRLEEENKALNDQLERGVDTIHRLTKEKSEANEALLHYHALKNALSFIGEAMRGDQSGNHEED